MTDTTQMADRRAETIAGERLTQVLHDRYAELFNGAPEGEPTWVTTGGPEGGLNGTLAGLSAEQASRDVDGLTAAAHAEHVRWAVQLVNDYFDGKASQASWSESWTVREVDAEQWDRLRAELREAGEKLLENLRERQRWNDDMAMNGALASYGHTAYHLGALRQFMKRVTGGRA